MKDSERRLIGVLASFRDVSELLGGLFFPFLFLQKGKREAALRAKECSCDPAHDFFDESARDEGRHARALEGLLKRYFS